jgi:hypothetical protein
MLLYNAMKLCFVNDETVAMDLPAHGKEEAQKFPFMGAGVASFDTQRFFIKRVLSIIETAPEECPYCFFPGLPLRK